MAHSLILVKIKVKLKRGLMSEKNKEVVTISIRFPKWMYDEIEKRKNSHHRSINGEVIYMLSQMMKDDKAESESIG